MIDICTALDQSVSPHTGVRAIQNTGVFLAGGILACVTGVRRGRGRGNLGARERVGRARKKEKERLQGRYCFLRFLRSDSERKNGEWSELIKCQSSN